MTLRYASVCSGVGTDHLAFAPLGWDCAWFSEVDPFANAVLAHRFPDVPNVGDMTAISDEELKRHGPIDLLVGGTPCQGFSVAGRGKGLDDPRSQLALAFVRLVRRTAPRWVVWENVGGARNARHAGDLRAFILAFREIGYLGCFRSLDARYFGVPQRRDRVFAVFHPGDWRPPAAVLFEPDCVRRDSPKGREARADVASAVTRGLGTGGADDTKAQAGRLVAATLKGYSGRNQVESTYIPIPPPPLARTVNTKTRQDGTTETLVAHTLRASGFDASEDGSGRGTPLVFDERNVTSPENRSRPEPGGACHTLHAAPLSIAWVPDVADPVAANEARTYSNAGNNARPRNVVAYGIRSDAAREGSAKTPGPDAEGNVRLRDPGLGVSEEIAPTLDAARPHAVAFGEVAGTVDEGARVPGRAEATVVGFNLRGREGGSVPEVADEASVRASPGGSSRTYVGVDLQNAALRAHGEAGTIQAAQDRGNRAEAVMSGLSVRRLTPLECERLQGLPDYFTWVPYPRSRQKVRRTRLAKDAPRYKAIGNGIALPCLAWIAERLTAVDGLLRGIRE